MLQTLTTTNLLIERTPAMPYSTIDNLKNLYDLARIPVVLKDHNHTIVYANNAYADFLGCDREALISTDGGRVHGAEAAKEFREHDRAVFDTGEETTRDFDMRLARGGLRRVRITKSRIFIAGRPYVFGVISELAED